MAEPMRHHLHLLLELTKLLAVARARSEERAKVTHERFNVFTTLLEAHDEVRLHTRFLHNLLNPDGTHDCGFLFLDLFFQTLAEYPSLDATDSPTMWCEVAPGTIWTVRREVSSPEGQMDLLLETAGVGIAIENKIWAGEQEDQLKRYASYLQRRYGDNGRLLYLTLDGKPATTNGEANYLRISYQRHLLPWLERCLQATYRFIPINQVLLQYREVVRELTGQTFDTRLMNTIAEFIIQHPDIIRYQQQVSDGINEAKVVFLDRLADELQQRAPEGYGVRPRPDMGAKSFGRHENGAFIISPPPNSPLHGKPFEVWLEYISKWSALVIGIECKLDKVTLTEAERLHLREMNVMLDMHSIETKYHKADPHVLCDGTEWPTGWHDLIGQIWGIRLADLFELGATKVAQDLWPKIVNHISLLERVDQQVADKGLRTP